MSTVLVTSVESPLGKSIALDLTSRGHTVFGATRNRALADAVGHETHHTFSVLSFDPEDEAEVRSSMHLLEERLGGRGLAAIVHYWPGTLAGPLSRLPMQEIRRVAGAEIFGALILAREALPLLRLHDPDPGRLIQVGSLSALHAYPFFGSSAIARRAQEGMLDALRIEWAQFGISISSILPGKIQSPVSDETAVALRQWQNDPDFGQAVRRIAERYCHSQGASIERILRSIRHAVESSRPRRRYTVREGMPLSSWLLGLIPMQWTDRLFLQMLGGRVE